MKKLIALCICMAMALALFSGCEINFKLGGDDDSSGLTTIPFNVLTPEAVKEAAGGKELDALSAEERAALEAALRNQGYNVDVGDGIVVKPPEGVTLPPIKAPATQPATLPSGQQTSNSEVSKFVKKVQDTIKTRTFYLKGNMNSPLGGNANGSYAGITMAVDQDKLVVESEADWVNMLQQQTDDGNVLSFGQARVQGAIYQTTLGSRVRMLFLSNAIYTVFPDKKIYMNTAALAEADGSEMGDMGDIASEVVQSLNQFSAPAVPGNLKATKVAVNGQEYLCATIPSDEGTSVRYYFTKTGELKRLEYVIDKDNNMIIEVESFTGKVDPNLFSVKDMKELKLADFMKILGPLTNVGLAG